MADQSNPNPPIEFNLHDPAARDALYLKTAFDLIKHNQDHNLTPKVEITAELINDKMQELKILAETPEETPPA